MGYKANITSNLTNQVLRVLVGALTGIVVARVLGPRGQGQVAYIILIFTLLGDYGSLGLNNAVMYFKKRGKQDTGHLFNVNLTALSLLSLAIGAVVLLLRATGLALTGYNYLYIFGGIVFVAADLYFSCFHSWYISDERILESNKSIIIVFFMKSAAILLLWLLGWLTPSSFFGVTVLSMLLNAVFLRAGLKQSFRPAFDLNLLKAEYAYGGILWLGAVFAFLHYRVDQIMIKHILGVSELGVYTVAVNLAELMFLIPISITPALLGRLYNTDDPAAARRVMAQTFKLNLYVCVVLAAIGIPCSLLIPLFYGQAYAGAVYSTVVLLVGVVFASLAKVAAPHFFTQGKPGFHLAATFLTLALNVVLNFILIPLKGIGGAAIASTVSYLAYALFYLGLFLFREKFSLRELLILKAADIRGFWRNDEPS